MTLRRVWRMAGVGLILLVIWLSLTSSPIEIPVREGDKIGHLWAYATLMLWFAQLDTRQVCELYYAVAFIALGIVLEGVQGLTDYRTFQVGDVVANTIGVALGWIVAPPRGPHVLGYLERVF